jgi:two-component system, chemotaxis family, sensor kinase CheA
MTDGFPEDEMREIIEEFLVEAREHLDRLDADIVELEKDGRNSETIARVFRSVHTIKGTAGFLDFPRLEGLSHAGEDLLGAMRDGRTTVTPSVITPLLEMLDALRVLLDHIEVHGNDKGDAGDLDVLATSLRVAIEGSTEQPSVVESASIPLQDIDLPANTDLLAETFAAQPAPLTAAGDKALDKTGSPLRVDVALLDRLMNLVGELVLVRNRILQLSDDSSDPALLSASQRLNLITSELQEGVTHARMQPIGNVWAKVPRLVRDVSRALGKQVDIITEGAETELDKTILEAIADPMTHLVRNAIDHGVETPSVRQAAGKPESGTLRLRAYHEGGIVTIELSDDGAGIDTARVGAKAVASGLVSQERLSRMTEAEVMDFIFHAGFSTAEKVTNVSGRGVGMDVVRTSIGAIGGSVDVDSRPGVGTTFRVKIPLTLAIIPALIVAHGPCRFAIPQVNLVELVRIDASKVEGLASAPVYRLRGGLLPLMYLSETLGQSRDQASSYVLVLAAGTARFGLVVDEVRDTAEIVVKPLTSHLQGIGVFSGATVMGDGRVALILDAMGLATRAMGNEDLHSALIASHDDAPEELVSMLVATVGEDRRVAVRLDEVDRLEVFTLDMLERSAQQDVVQYRNGTMPLRYLATAVGASFIPSQRGLATIVCGGDAPVGVVVEQILDVVAIPVTEIQFIDDSMIMARAVINGKVADIVELASYIRSEVW